MIRRALALFFCLAAIPTAHAQPATEVCDNRFERYLKGYTVGRAELLPFIDDANAVAACRRQLDRSRPDHVLIEAYLRVYGRPRDPAPGLGLFDAACRQGSRLACAWSIAAALESESPVPRAEDVARRYETLIESDLPLVGTIIGMLRAASALHSPAELAAVKHLLQRASEQGDYRATWELSALAMVDIAYRRSAADPKALQRKAAEQGNIPIMLVLAEAELGDPERPGTGNPQAAFAWYHRAAEANPRWFQLAIAEANYRLALMLADGKGTPVDLPEHYRRLRRAAELGHEEAQTALERLP